MKKLESIGKELFCIDLSHDYFSNNDYKDIRLKLLPTIKPYVTIHIP